jgi:beta-lactamase regulating signal transducer with metallopeptidase domain
MPNDLAAGVVVLLGTYWLHSGLLLTTAWLVSRAGWVTSHRLSERLWQTAAVLPLLTACAQWAYGLPGVPIRVSSAIASSADLPAEKSAQPEPKASPFDAGASGELTDDRIKHAEPVLSSVWPDELSTAGLSDEFQSADRLPRDGPPRLETSENISSLTWDDTEEFVFEPETSPVPKNVERSRERADSPLPLPQFVTTAGYLAAVWLVWGCLRLALQTWLFHRRLADARRRDSGLVRRELDRLLRQIGSRRRVTLLSSGAFVEPVAFGLFHWKIVLPDGFEQRLERDELHALLAHELAHLARGDTLWLWIGRVLCSCFAFQPLNFLARRRWQQAAELLCDDWAVRHGAQGLALARCLTQIIEWRQSRGTPAGLVLTAGGQKSLLTARVERLLSDAPAAESWERPARRRLLATFVAAVAVALVWCGPRPALTADGNSRIEEPIIVEHSVEESSIDEAFYSATISTRGGNTPSGSLSLTEELQLLDVELERLEIQTDRAVELLRAHSGNAMIEELLHRLQEKTRALRHGREALSGSVAIDKRKDSKP